MVVGCRNVYMEIAANPDFWNGVIFTRNQSDPEVDEIRWYHDQKIIMLAEKIKHDLSNKILLGDSEHFKLYMQMTSPVKLKDH